MPTEAQARSVRASVAAYTRWAYHVDDPIAATQPAREGRHAAFVRRVDPDGHLARTNPGELVKRVERAKRAHYKGMALSRWAKRRREIAEARDA